MQEICGSFLDGGKVVSIANNKAKVNDSDASFVTKKNEIIINFVTYGISTDGDLMKNGQTLPKVLHGSVYAKGHSNSPLSGDKYYANDGATFYCSNGSKITFKDGCLCSGKVKYATRKINSWAFTAQFGQLGNCLFVRMKDCYGWTMRCIDSGNFFNFPQWHLVHYTDDIGFNNGNVSDYWRIKEEHTGQWWSTYVSKSRVEWTGGRDGR